MKLENNFLKIRIVMKELKIKIYEFFNEIEEEFKKKGVEVCFDGGLKIEARGQLFSLTPSRIYFKSGFIFVDEEEPECKFHLEPSECAVEVNLDDEIFYYDMIDRDPEGLVESVLEAIKKCEIYDD